MNAPPPEAFGQTVGLGCEGYCERDFTQSGMCQEPPNASCLQRFHDVLFRGTVVGCGTIKQAPQLTTEMGPYPQVTGLVYWPHLPSLEGKISFVCDSGFESRLTHAPAAGTQDLCAKVHLNG